MPGRQAVRAIIIKDQRLLAMKRNKFGLQYYTLVGGGIDAGEDAETALRRELREETSLEVGEVKLVFSEDAGDMYGQQFIYTVEYVSGEPQLASDSEEALISAIGQNTFEPVWLTFNELPQVIFRSSSVREAILIALQNGFPTQPQQLAFKA